MDYKHKQSGISFNAHHIASLSLSEWQKQAKGQFDLGAANAADEAEELAAIHAECTAMVPKGEEPGDAFIEQPKTTVPKAKGKKKSS